MTRSETNLSLEELGQFHENFAACTNSERHEEWGVSINESDIKSGTVQLQQGRHGLIFGM